MAHATFTVEVQTPEGQVFRDEVQQVSTRTTTGSISFLAGHQPLLGLVEPGELRLYKSDSEVVSFAQGEGYVQVSKEGVLLLVEEAQEPGALDAADLRERLQRAEQELESCEEGTAAHTTAQRDKRRWETFLRIAGGE